MSFLVFVASSVYKLICPEGGKAYISQTDRIYYKKKYKEHHLAFKITIIPPNLLNT
jgi:hypothetical protein